VEVTPQKAPISAMINVRASCSRVLRAAAAMMVCVVLGVFLGASSAAA
jgi:uncharacterized membrane protein YgaE (UPF0421/DUF939 family)